MTNKALFKRFYKYLIPHYRGLILVFFLLAVSSCASLASPYALKIIIDTILPGGTFSELVYILGGLVVIYIIRIGCNFLTEVLYTKMGQKIIASIQADINDFVLKKPISFFETTKPGDVIFLLMNDVGVIQTSLFSVILRFANDILSLIGIVVILLVLDFKLTSISLIIIPMLLFSSRKFTPLLQESFRVIQEAQERLNTYFFEVFRNHRVIKSYNTLSYECDRLTHIHGEIVEKSVKNSILNAANTNVITFFVAVGPIIVLMFGGLRVFSGAISIGSLVAFIQYLNRLYAPAMSLANTYSSFNKALVSMRRIADFLVPETHEEQINDEHSAHEFEVISFDRVSLTIDNQTILKDVNLQFKRGQVIGISGPSGSGKSSIVNLLCRFLTPTSGAILIDGKKSIYSDKNWNDNLGLIEKNHQLFHSSIAENIQYGSIDPSLFRFDEVISHAELSSVLMQLPDRAETIVTDFGCFLSDGQKQRISIARALFKAAKIIIIDEATSSLDLELEAKVICNIKRYYSNSIVIFITHRITSLHHCDHIYFINQGSIISEDMPEHIH